MTMRYSIDRRPAPVGALALFALLLLDEFAGATVRESRTFEKRILDEIGASL